MIVTGDAIFTQKEICQTIIDRSGHYFFTVKMNQPTLHDDIALAFGSDSPLCAVRPA
ncbi:MAG: transposase [Alphaproteobacteria bacterium]|nr:transposase [Alphaproteobacteria bacterium]